jgi:protocatechuate 3,4-dioxygenase beta subunit
MPGSRRPRPVLPALCGLTLLLLAVPAAAPAAAAEVPLEGRVVTADGAPLGGARVALLPLQPQRERMITLLTRASGPVGMPEREVGPRAAAPTPPPGSASEEDADPSGTRAPAPPGRGLAAAARTFTDDAGRFALAAPRPGHWRLLVTAPGHVPAVVELVPLLDATALPDATLEPDEGTTVTVRDAGGAPVANALVHATTSSPGRFRSGLWRQPARWSRTDARGTARLSRAAGDALHLSACAPGLGCTERRTEHGTAAALTVPGAVRHWLEVRGPGGAPVVGAVVVHDGARLPLARSGDGGAVIVSAAAGAALTVIGPDGARAAVTVRAEPAAADTRAAAASAENDPAAPRPQVVRLPDTRRVAGRVVDAATGGGVEGALAWDLGQAAAPAVTGAGGAYELTGLPAGSARLSAGAPGYLPAAPLDLPPAGLAGSDGPTLALEPAAAIEGVVVDGAGEPLAGVDVTAREWERPTPGRFSFRLGGPTRPPAAAVTGADGRFRLAPLDAGEAWEITARQPGRAAATHRVETLEPRRTHTHVRLVLAPGATARGRVTDAAERGLAGARVTLRAAPAQTGAPPAMARRMAAGKPPVAAAETGADGVFALEGLASGRFELRVTRSGYAPRELRGIEITASGDETDIGTIALDEGEELDGRVTDPDGQPLAGVEVRRLASSLMARWTNTADPDAVSDPEGWFAVRNLAPDQAVNLAFRRTGFVEKTVPGIETTRTEPLRVELEPASRVSGIVTDAAGEPVTNATVVLSRAHMSSDGSFSFVMTTRDEAEVDAQGRFVYEEVAPGEIDLEARAPGYRAVERTLEVPQGADLEDIELPLEAGAIVAGRVLRADGTPAVGARVGPVRQGEPIGPSASSRARTDGDGAYLLDGLPPGPATIEATADAGLRAVRDVELREGRNELDLRFEGGQEVTGRVEDESGAPLAAAHVRLEPLGSMRSGPETTTGAAGRFGFEGVRAGQYRVEATHPDRALAADPPVIDVVDQPLHGIIVVLGRGGTIEGTVRGLDERELGQLELWADGGAGGRDIRRGGADRSGAFRFERVTPGSWTITGRVDASGRRATTEVDVATAGAIATAELVFERGVVLTGRAMQGDRPVVGATLLAAGQGVDASGSTTTDLDGRFRVEGLAPGRYELWLRDWDSGLSYREIVDMSGDRDVTLEIPAGAIAGRVVDEVDGAPLSGARVVLQPAEGGGTLDSSSTTTDLDGTFRFAPVSAGGWRIVASREGYAAQTKEVSLRGDGDVEDVELKLDPTEGLLLEVRTTGAQAAPEHVRVAIVGAGGGALLSGTYGTGEAGRVRLASVPRGRWEVVVQGEGTAAATVVADAPGGPVPVTLAPPARLRVRVPALAGEAAGGGAVPGQVVLTDERGLRFRKPGWIGGSQEAWRLTGGDALVEGLPPGRWTVRVDAADGRTWSGTAQVGLGGAAELVLD